MSRVYGRTYDELGNPTWQVVTTDPGGFNDLLNTTWLAQVLKLNLGESPFWATWGIPAYPAVVQQVYPDYYVALTQQRFAPLFGALIVAKVPGVGFPSYNITATTQQGSVPITGPVPT